MHRKELGERLLSWHASIHDPIYAVGSFYFEEKVHPQRDAVENAITNLSRDLDERQRMLRGEKVSRYNSYYGRVIPDQREFAGYSDSDLKRDIADLQEVSATLYLYLKRDYGP